MWKTSVVILLPAAGTVSPCWLMFQPELSSCLARTSDGTGMSDKKFRDWSLALMTECSQIHLVPVLWWRHFLLPWWEIARDQSHHPLFCRVLLQPVNLVSCHLRKKKRRKVEDMLWQIRICQMSGYLSNLSNASNLQFSLQKVKAWLYFYCFLDRGWVCSVRHLFYISMPLF